MRSPHHPPASSSASLAGHNPATATLDWTTARRRFPQRLLPRKPSSLALKRAQQPPAAAITSRPRSGASRSPSTPQSNRHSARGTVGTSSPACSFPGGFRTTASVQAEPSRWAVIRNPSHIRTHNAASCRIIRSPRQRGEQFWWKLRSDSLRCSRAMTS